MVKKVIKDLAKQRIKWLFNLALVESRKGNYNRARRYAELIIKVAEKGRVKIPRGIKRRVCHNCKVILIPGVTSTIRLRGGGKSSHIVVRCLICGWIKRYPIKVRKNEKTEEN